MSPADILQACCVITQSASHPACGHSFTMPLCGAHNIHNARGPLSTAQVTMSNSEERVWLTPLCYISIQALYWER